jgi:hypothetical protein
VLLNLSHTVCICCSCQVYIRPFSSANKKINTTGVHGNVCGELMGGREPCGNMGLFVKPDGNAMVQLWERNRATLGTLAELWEPSGTVGLLGTQ